MKKFKALMLGFVMLMAVGMFTACGDVPEPTEDDILDAFEDEEILTKDQIKNEEYELEIGDIEIDDDQEKATVECTLSITNGSVCYSTEFELKFKIKDDKESWKFRKLEAGETTEKLVAGISDEDLESYLSWSSFSIDGDYIYFDSSTTEYEIKEHKLDAEEKTDTITIEGTGQYGLKTYEFTLECVCQYEYGWNSPSIEVVESDSEYVEGYEHEFTEEEVMETIQEYDSYIYVMGVDYYFTDSDMKVEGVEIGEVEFDEFYCTLNADATISKGDIKFTKMVEISYEFDTDSKEWELNWINWWDTTSFTCSAIGTWVGTVNGNSVTLTISEEFLEDYTCPKVLVEGITAEGEAYSYTAYVGSYGVGEDSVAYMEIWAYEWVTKVDTVWMSSFEGYIGADGVFVPEYSWDEWSFTKQ